MSMAVSFRQPMPPVEAAVDPADPMRQLSDTMQANWALIASAAQEDPARYPSFIASFADDKATLHQKMSARSGVITTFYANSVGLWHMQRVQYEPSKDTDSLAQGGLTSATSVHVAAEGVRPSYTIDEAVLDFGDTIRPVRRLSQTQGEALTGDNCLSLMHQIDLRKYATEAQQAQPARPHRVAAAAHALASALWKPVGKR